MSLLLAIAALAQGQVAGPDFPANVEISQRYDCSVHSPGQEKERFQPYPVGDYIFLFPADTGLIVGKSIPYIHTLADGRTYFERATIEAADPKLGPSFGFALRTRPGGTLAFATISADAGEKTVLRGSYRTIQGRDIELEGECRVRSGPIPVDISSP